MGTFPGPCLPFQLVLNLTKREDGSFLVVTAKLAGSIEPFLSSLGFPGATIAEVTAHINLGQVIEFRDKEGVPILLRFNPKDKKIEVRPKDLA